MTSCPDYKRATNAPYELLHAHYYGRYPVINVLELATHFSNIRLHSYTEMAKKLNVSYCCFLRNIASSEHGFTIKCPETNNYLICINEQKDNTTRRFTVAHELGHIILNHTEDDEVSDKEANCFARNLLCPLQIVDNFGVQTVQDYVNCFEISEPMAEVTISNRKSDEYYITRENYQLLNDAIYFYFSGYGYNELYLYG